MQIKYQLSLISLVIWIQMVTIKQCANHHKFLGRTHKPIIRQYQVIKDGHYSTTDDGSYHPGNEGRYIHQNVQHKHHDHRTSTKPESTQLTSVDDDDLSDDLEEYFQPNRLGFSFTKGSKNNANGLTYISNRTPPALYHSKLKDGHNLKAGHTGNNKNRAKKISPKSSLKGATPSNWAILHLESEQDDNSYHYRYETENGILVEEFGELDKLGSSDVVLRSNGFYSYTGDDGVLYRVDYTADEDGFVPQGDHIP